MTSEVTLGQLRNRISQLFADKQYRPDIPLSAVLTVEELRLLASSIPTEASWQK